MLSGTIRHDASQTGGAHVEDFLSTTPTRQAFGDSVRLSGSDAGYSLHLIPFVQSFQTGTFEIPTTASARISFGLNTYEAYAGKVTVTTNGYDASLSATVIKGTFDIPFYDHVTAGQFYNIDDGEFTVLY